MKYLFLLLFVPVVVCSCAHHQAPPRPVTPDFSQTGESPSSVVPNYYLPDPAKGGIIDESPAPLPEEPADKPSGVVNSDIMLADLRVIKAILATSDEARGEKYRRDVLNSV